MEWQETTSRATDENGGWAGSLSYWLLLDANRWVVTALVVTAVGLLVAALAFVGVVEVGPRGFGATLFGSGLTSGVLTLTTIALSINQLILARVFGSPNQLSNRLAGTRELRDRVESHAGLSSSPNDPALFFALIGSTIHERASGLAVTVETSTWEPSHVVTEALEDIADYGEDIDERIDPGVDIVDILDVVLGQGYARNTRAVQHIRTEYESDIPDEIDAELEVIEELLE